MVEYVNYSLIILAMLVTILILVRLPDRVAKPLRDDQRKTQLSRELAKVPIPWGWPNYEKVTVGGGHPEAANGHMHSFTESLHHWTNRLVQEKPTVDDAEYQRKKESSMRTMVEDRYGRMDKIEARLLRKGQTGEVSLHVRQLKLEQQTGLEHLKMPWGW